MKKLSYLLCLLIAGIGFTACDEKSKNLTFDQNSVEVIITQTAVVKISGGIAPYTAKEADKTIATATIDKSEMTIKGLKEGQTTIDVSDKDGKSGKVIIKVIKDPYETDKKEATVRFAWDKIKKVKGTDDGTYSLTKDDKKRVTFTWKKDDKNSIVLSFTDATDKVKEPAAKSTRATPALSGKLVVTTDGKPVESNVTAYNVIQIKAAKEGDPATFWITFKADNKEGLVVSPLAK